MKKIIAIFLGVLFVVAMLPMQTFAASYNGTCGDNAYWSLDTDTGVLTISGSGDMYDYDDMVQYAPWYSQIELIKSVNIENSITSIGEEAFYGCSSFTSIAIPDSVTSIGYGAFNYCSSLTRITIPDGVTNIGHYAFRNCSSLIAINVGGGNQSFSSQDGVLFNKNKTELIDYPEGKSGEYVIPDGVTSICDGAFSGCDSLTSINIPDGVTGIGNSAFSGCSSLTSVTIPDSVTCIGDGAFRNCNSLTSITIPASVISIGDWAFENCSSLTSITIPDGVTNIGQNPFYRCSSLIAINVGGGNQSFSSQDGVLFNKNKTELIDYPEGKSGEYVIPDGVTGIGGGAFYGCNGLTSITIPDGVTNIYGSTFNYCSSLNAINVGGGNQSFSSQDGVLFNKNKTEVIDCPEGKSGEYVIPDSVTSIADWAFFNCSSLTSITIPDGVTSIDDHTFSGCSSLTSVTIPDSVTCIGDGAFCNCNSLTSINIPDGVTGIGDSAFSDCSSLTRITIPDSVTSIGWCAFSYCSNLTCITIPDSVTNIGAYAFSHCSSLTRITIPNSVTSIGSDAFYYCANLTIKCYKDSTVYNYAVENNIPYVLIKEYGVAPNAPTVATKTYNSVTLVPTEGYEYKIDNGEWQDSNVFSGLNPNKTYIFYQRVKESETAYASESSLGTEVTTDKISVAAPSEPTVATKTHNSVTLTATNGYEYKMDNGEWQDSNVFSGLNPNKTYIFYQRVKESETAYASESSLGTEVTTDKMSVVTPSNPAVETKTYNSVTLVATEGYEYKMDNGKWQDSNVFSGLNPNKTYTFYQRVKETDTAKASEQSTGTAVTTLKMPSNKPNAPTVATKTHNSVTLTANSSYEYKMDNGKWQDSNVFNGLNPNKTYSFYQRVKETNTTYASESSAGTKVTTDKKSVSAPKAPTVANKTTNTVTLTKVSGCEYSKDGKTWQSSNVFKSLKAETEYTFYQRVAETDTSYASGKSVALKVKTMPKETLINEKGVWYYTVNDQKVNTTTLVSYYGVWYYVEKGKANFNATTLCKYGNTWYYVEKGKVNFNATTLCKYGNTWYYVDKGKANFNATTLCKYGNTWYYVEKGKVNFNATTLCKYGNTWYYVEKGKVNFNSTTLCKYGNTWYYVQNGKVNFNATTLCKYGNTWYYVQNGKVNFNATLRFNYYGKYYNVRNGVVKF